MQKINLSLAAPGDRFRDRGGDVWTYVGRASEHMQQKGYYGRLVNRSNVILSFVINGRFQVGPGDAPHDLVCELPKESSADKADLRSEEPGDRIEAQDRDKQGVETVLTLKTDTRDIVLKAQEGVASIHCGCFSGTLAEARDLARKKSRNDYIKALYVIEQVCEQNGLQTIVEPEIVFKKGDVLKNRYCPERLYIVKEVSRDFFRAKLCDSLTTAINEISSRDYGDFVLLYNILEELQ